MDKAVGRLARSSRRQDLRTCQKYERGADINFVPSSATTTLPDVAPSQPLPVAEPPAPPETRREVTEPSTPPSDEQEYYPYYYDDYPGVYWLFVRPRAFPFHRHSHSHSAPR